MKHAGLPWELGLIEAHRALRENQMREHVELRVDGGLLTGKDLVTAAILGAEGFEFGKLLLVAEGCMMARICEKNTCPAGIATHDPKFKARYSGSPEAVQRMLAHLAGDVRRHLAALGVASLEELQDRVDLFQVAPDHAVFVRDRKLDLSGFLDPRPQGGASSPVPFNQEGVAPLNQQILADAVKSTYNMALYSYMGLGTALVMSLLGYFIGKAGDQLHERAAELDTLHGEVASQKEIFENRYKVLDNNIKNFHQIGSRIQKSIQKPEVLSLCAEGLHDIAHMLTSKDRVTWEEQGSLDIRLTSGKPLSPGPYGTPTVWVEGPTWYLFYERRDEYRALGD